MNTLDVGICALLGFQGSADPSTWKIHEKSMVKPGHFEQPATPETPQVSPYVSLAPLKNPKFWRSMIRKVTPDLPKPFQTDE